MAGLRVMASLMARQFSQRNGTTIVSKFCSGAVFGGDSSKGYSVPPEHHPHKACMVGWPWDGQRWPCNAVRAKENIKKIIKTLIDEGEENVILIAHPEKPAFTPLDIADLTPLCSTDRRTRLEIWAAPLDDCYLRDIAPIFIVNREQKKLRGISWTFNDYGWQNPSFKWKNSANLAKVLCDKMAIGCVQSDLVCEGGAIVFNGLDTVIATKSVLCDYKRNPGWLVEDIEDSLKFALGCEKVIWLEKGLPHDTTGGHADNLVSFVSPTETVLSWVDEERDPETHKILSSVKECLEYHGLTVNTVDLPDQVFVTPDEIATLPVGSLKEDKKPASYVNFYIANKAVIVPQFDQPHWDSKAIATLEKAFAGSNRKVIGVPTLGLMKGGGNIHCLTQQVPSI